MPENKFYVTDTQLQDILRNENFGIECDETNDTSIHAIVSDLVNLRERNKNGELLAKIEVLEELKKRLETLNPFCDTDYEEGKTDALRSVNVEIDSLIELLKDCV